jgi:hypothetical protein
MIIRIPEKRSKELRKGRFDIIKPPYNWARLRIFSNNVFCDTDVYYA